MNRKRGFTLVELLVVIAIIALLVSLLLPALGKALANARTIKDQTQIEQLHGAMLSFATTNKGRYLVPGLVNRLAADLDGGTPRQLPGIGPEDYAHNSTDHLYAAMIAQNLISTELIIGPTEVSPVVEEDTDYDFTAYDPGNDVYWDNDHKAFVNGLPSNTRRSNTSYAHMAIIGDRKSRKWRNTNDPGDPAFSTRGTRFGANPGDAEYDESPTLLLHGFENLWVGNVCFNDNHAETIDTFYPETVTYEEGTAGIAKDNIFNAEFGDESDPNPPITKSDAFLCISTSANEDTLSTVWDSLQLFD